MTLGNADEELRTPPSCCSQTQAHYDMRWHAAKLVVTQEKKVRIKQEQVKAEISKFCLCCCHCCDRASHGCRNERSGCILYLGFSGSFKACPLLVLWKLRIVAFRRRTDVLSQGLVARRMLDRGRHQRRPLASGLNHNSSACSVVPHISSWSVEVNILEIVRSSQLQQLTSCAVWLQQWENRALWE